MDLKTSPPHGSVPSAPLPAHFDESTVAAWLAALPLANRDACIDSLLVMLPALQKQSHIPCGERLAILERILSVAEIQVQQYSRSQLADEAFPLPQSAQRVASRCFLIARALGDGYRRIAMDPDFMSEWALAGQGRTAVLLRALQNYGQALLRLKLSYHPPPFDFWCHIYELFRLAEGNHLLKGAAGEATAITVEGSFLALMLFPLAPTNRHRPRDIRQIFLLLQRFSARARLASDWQQGDQKALFVVDLDSDREPRRVSTPDLECGGGLRFLFTRGLVESMIAHFSGPVGMSEFGGGLSGGLVKRLVRALGVPERRKSLRRPDAGERAIIIGLKSVIEALWRGRQSKDLPEARSSLQYKGVKWLNVPDFQVEILPDDRLQGGERFVRSERALGTLIREHATGMSREDIWGENRFSGPAGFGDTSNLKAAMINSSARGCCLLWAHRQVSCLKVGELIGFPTEQGRLYIGVARWLEQTAEGDVTIGVELIAPRTRAVSIYAVGRGAPEVALFLAEEVRVRGEPSILVSTAKFDVGQTITIDDAGGLSHYRIERLLESNPSFQQFTLSEEPSRAPAVL